MYSKIHIHTYIHTYYLDKLVYTYYIPSLMLEAFRLLPRLNVELGTSAREKEEKFYENQSSLLVKYLQL